VAVDSTHVYWVTSGAGIFRNDPAAKVNKVPLGGGSVTTLASGQSGPVSVAVDGTHVYWTNSGDGTVNEVPIGGGKVTRLAADQGYPNSLAVGH
jgi:DNA-binding beta-propeller fold protein YncE